MKRDPQLVGWTVKQVLPDGSVKTLSMRFTIKSSAEQFVAIALKSGMNCYIAEERKIDKVGGT